MKLKFSLCMLAICCAISYSIPSFGEVADEASSMKEKIGEKKEKIGENSAESAGEPVIFAPIREQRFPATLDGESVVSEFKIFNRGTGELKISKIKTG